MKNQTENQTKKQCIPGVMLGIMLCVCCMNGCGKETGENGFGISVQNENAEKIADLDYTLVADEEIPQELMDRIAAVQNQELRLTYSEGEFLYIVRGYGEQPRGSSIQLLELYETNEGIVCRTQLVGGGKTDDDATTRANPYIVVKLPCDGQNVVFE